MVAQSQRPLVNRILAIEPLKTAQGTFASVDEALGVLPLVELAEALSDHDVQVTRWQLARWRRELEEEQG